MCGGRSIVVGDVHGCPATLDALLEEVHYRPEDHLVLTGDLINKGPDSGGVLDRVDHWRRRGRVSLVEGNHERAHRRQRWLTQRGSPAAATVNAPLMGQLTRQQERVLGTMRPVVRLPEHGAVVVHAGVPERLRSWPGVPVPVGFDAAGQAESAGGWGEWVEPLQSVRWLDRDGRPVGKQPTAITDVLWPVRYDGRFGRVFFGHTPFRAADEPPRWPHAVGLDLGCADGNRLAAAVLAGDDVTLESVPRRDGGQGTT
jgi:hypothetical protein